MLSRAIGVVGVDAPLVFLSNFGMVRWPSGTVRLFSWPWRCTGDISYCDKAMIPNG